MTTMPAELDQRRGFAARERWDAEDEPEIVLDGVGAVREVGHDRFEERLARRDLLVLRLEIRHLERRRRAVVTPARGTQRFSA